MVKLYGLDSQIFLADTEQTAWDGGCIPQHSSTGMGDTDVLHEQGRPSSDVVMVQDNGQML